MPRCRRPSLGGEPTRTPSTPERSLELLARYPRATRWSGRIVGGILIVVGVVLLFVAAFGDE